MLVSWIFVLLVAVTSAIQNDHLQSIYSVRSMDDLETNHADKVANRSNIFYFKDTKSSLYYSRKTRHWIELKQQNPDEIPQRFPLEYWIPASYCLDSRFGDGGTISRLITVLLEVGIENYIDIYASLPSFAIHDAVGLSLGVKVGASMTVTLLFSCALRKGEVIQMQYRPSYMIVPAMEAIPYKFYQKKFKKNRKKVKIIRPFKTLVIDAPEHQCWATTNINDLRCLSPVNHRHLIRF